MKPALHLASASPRRADILRGLGLAFTQGGADLDETRLPGESPGDMVVRLAREKAEATQADGVVLAADTTVVLGQQIFEKPRDREDARTMLSSLSGNIHEVMTGVAVRSSRGTETCLSVSKVGFRDIDDAEIDQYWASGEPRDKAGAYAIQGLGGVFVNSLSGSYSGVVGLPVYETSVLLAAAGINILEQE